MPDQPNPDPWWDDEPRDPLDKMGVFAAIFFTLFCLGLVALRPFEALADRLRKKDR